MGLSPSVDQNYLSYIKKKEGRQEGCTMKWTVVVFFVICAEAQLLPHPPQPCIYPSKDMCIKHCYCAWCNRCFEVTRFEKDMPPIVEAECGSANASYTTYMYSEYCEIQTVNIEAAVKTLVGLFYSLCGLGILTAFGLGFYGCYLAWFQKKEEEEYTEKDPEEG